LKSAAGVARSAAARVPRRRLLKSGAAAGILAATGAAATGYGPLREGALRLALSGARTDDWWDSRRRHGVFMGVAGQGTVFDCLTEIAADGTLVGELAESWDASPDARVWAFKLRRGVTFHNGKPFGAEDVIASLGLHTGAGAASPAGGIVKQIEQVRALDAHRVEITLLQGNADFPFLMADAHLVMYPSDMVGEAMAQGIGTGLYGVETFEPGVRMQAVRVDTHYKDGKAGWFHSVDMRAIEDPDARLTALQDGTVHAIDHASPQAAAVLDRDPDVALLAVTGNQHISLSFASTPDTARAGAMMRALKHALDRDRLVAAAFNGFGAPGADHPIGPANHHFAASLTPPAYDTQLARNILAHHGLVGAPLTVSTDASECAYVRSAEQLILSAAQEIGLKPARTDVSVTGALRIRLELGRATEDWAFSVAELPAQSPLTELLRRGRQELDTATRAGIYAEAQALMSSAGQILVPAYVPFLDAHSVTLAHGGTVGNLAALDSGRIAERWWMA